MPNDSSPSQPPAEGQRPTDIEFAEAMFYEQYSDDVPRDVAEDGYRASIEYLRFGTPDLFQYRLKQVVAFRQASESELRLEVERLRKALSDLEAKLAAAEKDSKRLDFMISEGSIAKFGRECLRIDWDKTKWSEGARMAIDACMALTPQSTEGKQP